jgi:hypothetical protein
VTTSCRMSSDLCTGHFTICILRRRDGSNEGRSQREISNCLVLLNFFYHIYI